jgi:hypothetical protein
MRREIERKIMNASFNTLACSGLCEVSSIEMTAIDGGHPAVRVGLFLLGYAAEKVMDELLSGPGLLEIYQQAGLMD